MTQAPSFEEIFAVMSAASVGDTSARVVIADPPALADGATKCAIALNILLDDLDLSAAARRRELVARTRLAERVQILADASREFSAATGDLDLLLDVVARRLGGLVGDMCTLRAVSEDGEWLGVNGGAYHRDPALLAVTRAFLASDRRRVGEGLMGRVAASGEPLLLRTTDAATFAASTLPQYQTFVAQLGVTSFMALPLLWRGKVVGVACLARGATEHPYDEDDLEFVQSVADHAAIAIANARSYAAEHAARDAAEKATARFARLRDAGILGISVVDLDGRVVEINDTLLRLLGYSREEILSGAVAWSELTPPEWHVLDARAVEQLTTAGVAEIREKEYRRKDGTRVPVLVGTARVAAASTECISFVLDLTARKEAERARRDAEQRSQRIVESAMVGIWMLDAENKTTFMNARMARILGADLTAAMRTPLADFFPEDRGTIDERLAERGDGVAQIYEQRFRRADGTLGLLSIEASRLHDADGRFDGVLGIVSDITERRRTEEELRTSEARYRRMFESSPLPKWMYDSETLRFLDANEAAVRDFGYSREEFRAMTIKDFRPAEDIPALLEAERDAATMPSFGVSRLRKKSGEIIQVEITKHSFELAGRPCRLAVGRDLTDRLRLEEQLRQSQKMEAIGRLAGGVAHDFNNILSVVLSYAQFLLAEMSPTEPMRADAQEIYKAGKRATELTKQLLMFSRQQVLESKVIDLNDLLTSMDKMLQRILGADVDLVSLPARALGRVRVDPSSVEQIIMNLVVNARDAMPTGGKLTMETANVVLDEAYAKTHLGVKPGPHVMLAISDTGTGMGSETLERIFEPFFTTKGAGKGTGLGLSTVFGIAQQSGGSVWVYSELGKGTTFKVYLPRVDAPVDALRELGARATLRGTETILLVEDDDQVRVVARNILRRSGYQIIEARNAGEALLHSEAHPGAIDLLLSDVVMPQMSGPALAKRLASDRPEMKVLCMSGYTDDSIVRHGVLEAHIAFLQKPLTPETLTTRVREVLDGVANGRSA